jgi:hypothetical protein
MKKELKWILRVQKIRPRLKVIFIDETFTSRWQVVYSWKKKKHIIYLIFKKYMFSISILLDEKQEG